MASRIVPRARKAPSRSTKKPARGRKPKLIEIAGHQLTPDLHREYEHRLESRHRTNRDQPQEHIEALALSDVLSRFRFSMRGRELFPALYAELSSLALAVAVFDRYPFYDHDPDHVRRTGCDALNRLAAEAQLIGAKIHAIGEAIRYESREHLQDWVARKAAFDAASAYSQPPTVQP